MPYASHGADIMREHCGLGEREWLAKKNKGTVGVIGLGIMGGAFAHNLAAAGWRVVGYDIERRAPARAMAAPASRSRRARSTVAAQAPVDHHQPAASRQALAATVARHRRRASCRAA